jgi:phosphoribosylglycinamide formyltransferase-1
MVLAKLRLAVMVSGGGTNLQSILDACAGGRIDAEVALVISNVADAYALERARLAGVPGVCVPAGRRSGTPEWEQADPRHLSLLAEHGVELICMAGYMRRLGPRVLEAYQGRVLNIHPALVPSFVGAHGQRDAVEYGVRISGCSVHFADAQFDTGPVIIQAAVPVLPGDDAASLGARILVQEHRIYPQAIQWYAQGRLRIEGRRVIVENAPPPTIVEAIISPGLDMR